MLGSIFNDLRYRHCTQIQLAHQTQTLMMDTSWVAALFGLGRLNLKHYFVRLLCRDVLPLRRGLTVSGGEVSTATKVPKTVFLATQTLVQLNCSCDLGVLGYLKQFQSE
ncbi:hypothetical protein BV898_01523 [Hypsibius exemplaris]|uniref:Uncharacterized protein n=1 Tax=Hypsibius exemplaris TaxID=2072580 RepID=A0A1W0XA99_HYPEX|nr:hypothetical protein BV898_01523 [Hypsibius exemplaris]